jgi:hypothetical protein
MGKTAMPADTRALPAGVDTGHQWLAHHQDRASSGPPP